MDVRYISTQQEAVDYLKISSASFIWKFDAAVDDHVDMPVMCAFDGDRMIAGSEVLPFSTNYCGTFINAVVASGVCSIPEARRLGGVRAIFEKIEEIAIEKDWTIGLLFPFSISYYEKFGYANLNRLFAIKVPFANMNNIPRSTDVIPYAEEHFDEICELHGKCALKENLMTLHDDKKFFCDKPLENADYTYFHRDENGIADGYVRFTVSRPETLFVNDLYVLNASALKALTGFLRNYDGIVKNLVVRNQYPGSPFSLMADRIPGAFYDYNGGCAGRIYNLRKLLEVNKYPEEYGKFSLLSLDHLPQNKGIFDVEYEHGKATVIQRADGEYDLALSVTAAARLMLAGEGHTMDTAAFIDGAEIKESAKDFFRAFPYRPTRFIENF